MNLGEGLLAEWDARKERLEAEPAYEHGTCWRPVLLVFSRAYGNTNEASGLRPGQPNEMCSDVPSHVTSVTTMTAAANASVRRRGIRSVILSVRAG